MRLTHHLHTGKDYGSGEWAVALRADAPKISDTAATALRRRVRGNHHTSTDPIQWNHCDIRAWNAVTDLHKTGKHDDAVRLATLLQWCDQCYPTPTTGFWEFRT